MNFIVPAHVQRIRDMRANTPVVDVVDVRFTLDVCPTIFVLVLGDVMADWVQDDGAMWVLDTDGPVDEEPATDEIVTMRFTLSVDSATFCARIRAEMATWTIDGDTVVRHIEGPLNVDPIAR